jgi:hypothetical protein
MAQDTQWSEVAWIFFLSFAFGPEGQIEIEATPEYPR